MTAYLHDDARYEYQDVKLDRATSAQWLNLYRQCGWDLIDIRQGDQLTVRMRRDQTATNYANWVAQERSLERTLRRRLWSQQRPWLSRLR